MDFGDGKITVVPADKEIAAQLNVSSRGSFVSISGFLRQHSWSLADGSQRECLQLTAQRLVVLYDARRGRMLL